MTDERPTGTDEDPVRRRIAHILDARRRENEERLGTLRGTDDAWEGLNKEVDGAIGREFDLLATEREAVRKARKLLERPETSPSGEGFVVGGRIFEKAKKAGLPHVAVRIVRELEDGEELLAETLTDEMGNFRGLVPKHLLEGTERAKETLRFEALAGPGEEPVLIEKKSIRMETGRVEELDFAVPDTRKVAEQIAAAESVRDSIEGIGEFVDRRLSSMKSAHTAVTRFAELTRDGLRALRRELSVEPPAIASAVPVAGIEPLAPEEEPDVEPSAEPARPPRPPTLPPTAAALRKVPGIGAERAKRLRAAGIVDLKTFLRTDTAKLTEILSFDARALKKEAERIVKERERARKSS